MFEIIRNPLFKFVGISLIIYFALFHSKRHPESLGNRLNSENIQSEIKDLKEKSKFIITNVSLARQLAHETEVQKASYSNKNAKISSKDTKIGTGNKILECGDEAQISYVLHDAQNKLLQSASLKKITLNNVEGQIIHDVILGMKRGGTREVNIPYGFTSKDQEFSENMRLAKSDLKYQITLLAITNKNVLDCE